MAEIHLIQRNKDILFRESALKLIRQENKNWY